MAGKAVRVGACIRRTGATAPLIRIVATLSAALMLVLALPMAQGAAESSKGRGSGTQVYLFRGWMNVFSTGMDDFGEQLTRRGIPASVYNHLNWSSAAADAASGYKAGRTRTIIAIGHSLGAGSVVSMVEQLGAQGVPVALAVTLDGNPFVVRAGRVGRFVNLYIHQGSFGGGIITRGGQFSGPITNTNVASFPDMGHTIIDKHATVHKMMMGYINQAMAAGAPAPPAADGKAATPPAKAATPPS